MHLVQDATPRPTLIQSHTVTESPTPAWLKVIPECIPAELRKLPQWVLWEAKWDGKKWKKPPYCPRTNRQASITNSNNRASFDVAMRNREQFGRSGVGFVLTSDDPYTVIDLDECRNPNTGDINTDARVIIDRFNSYTEASVSGTGVHIFVCGVLPPGRNRKGSIEAYSLDRYIVMTGHVIDRRTTIDDRQNVLTTWHQETFGQSTSTPIAPTMTIPTGGCETADVLAKCQQSSRFNALYRGDISAYRNNHSSADLAFCTLIANAGGNEQHIDELMRQSALYREKWERTGYRDGTIAKALDGRKPTPVSISTPKPTSTNTTGHNTGDDGELSRLRARVIELETALAREREDKEVIIRTISNPHIGNRAVTAVRLALRCLADKREGKSDTEGFSRVTYASLGGDYANDDSTPIRGRSTVKRDIDMFANAGLIKREVRYETIETRTKNPKTGELTTTRVPTPITWANFPGETLAELLTPFAFFAAPEQPKRSGGDRRSEAFKATRTPCPDCGSTERVTYCKGCGVNITEIVDAETPPIKFEITPLAQVEARILHAPPTGNPPSFQNVALSSPRGGSVIKFEITRESPPPWGTSESDTSGDGDEIPVASPPVMSFMSHPTTPVDCWTDITQGMRP